MIIFAQLHARVTLSTQCVRANEDLLKKLFFLVTADIVLVINSSDTCHQKRGKEQHLKVGADTTVMTGRLISPSIAHDTSSLLLPMIEN